MEGKEGTCHILRVQQIVPTPRAHKHKKGTPALWARQRSSPPMCQPICFFAFTNMPFFLSSFLVLYSFEYMRKKSGRQEER